MALGREAIYAALFSALQKALLAPAPPGFAQALRRPLNLAAPPLIGTFPAFALVEAGEGYDRPSAFLPARVMLTPSLYIYMMTTVKEPTDTTQTAAFNDLADAVEDAINDLADSTASVTLGGLVQKVRLGGRQVVTPPSEFNAVAAQRFALQIVLPHSR